MAVPGGFGLDDFVVEEGWVSCPCGLPGAHLREGPCVLREVLPGLSPQGALHSLAPGMRAHLHPCHLARHRAAGTLWQCCCTPRLPTHPPQRRADLGPARAQALRGEAPLPRARAQPPAPRARLCDLEPAGAPAPGAHTGRWQLGAGHLSAAEALTSSLPRRGYERGGEGGGEDGPGRARARGARWPERPPWEGACSGGS